MWPALTRATRLSYRATSRDASDRLDELLELLEENDHGALLRRRAVHVEGKLTWARLATLAVAQLTPVLLRGDDVDQALLLGARLAERDAHRNARVTVALRESVGRLSALARSLRAAERLRDGAEPSDALVYALLALHRHWWAVKRTSDAARADVAPMLALVQTAAGAVLQRGAPHLRGLATRALAQWTPAAPTPRAGVAVAWDDEL